MGPLYNSLKATILTSKWLEPLVRISTWIFPFDQISDIRKAANREFRNLKRHFTYDRNQNITILFSNRNSYPGFGDFLVLVMLEIFLNKLGFQARILASDERIVFDEPLFLEKVKLYKLLTGRELNFRQENFLPETECVIFSSRVQSNLDLTAPSLLLISRLFLDRQINPNREKPIWQAPNDFCSRFGIGKSEDAETIGFHVRKSQVNEFRNPRLSSIEQDAQDLLEAFPRARLKWFGEKAGYTDFLSSSKLSLSYLGRISYQSSSSFSDAMVEAMNADMWFQRFGGGIGAISLFLSRPYLIVSNDITATRLYMKRGRKIVPWASETQIYSLRVLKQDKSSRGDIDFLKEQLDARH